MREIIRYSRSTRLNYALITYRVIFHLQVVGKSTINLHIYLKYHFINSQSIIQPYTS